MSKDEDWCKKRSKFSPKMVRLSPNSEEPPAETLHSHCSLSIRGWENENEAEAREFGQVVMILAKGAIALS